MNLKSRPPASAYGILLLGLISISVSPILVRLAGDEPAISLAALRNAFAILMLTPVALVGGQSGFFKLSRSNQYRTVGAGVLLGFHFFMFFEAIQRTTVASATVFVAVTPIFIALMGYFFLHEKLTRPVFWAIVISVVGGILIAVGDAGQDNTAVDPIRGNFLALGACLFVSAYLVIGRLVRQQLSWLAYVYPVYLTCAITVMVLALATGAPLFQFEPRVYLICFLMAVGPHLLGHGSFNYAVKYFSATLLGLLALTEPIGATLMAFALFEELPGTLSFIGMGLTLAGVCLALYPFGKFKG